ncbi:lanthionine synthetase C family protein [Kribbella sp. NPDC056345]|uniref:lanthionine synthetase C family protein n=1 Tax=Kribbella sp. NPDC056345 TaxID=3345789 RepID=UPI0035E32A10
MTRERAAGIAAELADRLRDPDRVIAATVANGTEVEIGNVPCPPWDPPTLSRGPGALAILFSELGQAEDAHRYLRLTMDACAQLPLDGPFEGLGSLVSAARIAGGAYEPLLARLDARAAEQARYLIAAHAAARGAGRPTTAGVVDLIGGLTGIGRYLLHRGSDALPDVLKALVTLTEPVEVAGVKVPGWWYDATSKTVVGAGFEHGQLNFGLAHGIPGPLGLLALAWTADVRVPGQAEAIAAMADWLVEWQEVDAFGPYWTGHINLDYYVNRVQQPKPARASWCYGAPGIARSLELATKALNRPEWESAGLDAVRSLVARPMDDWAVTDEALCHGWSGLLHMFAGLDRRHPGEFTAVTETIAERLITAYNPDTPFGYRYYQPMAELWLDLPGLLEGAAGIALALDSYARNADPRSEWDTLLLLN